MKIAFVSDWHLGLNWGSELEMDSFAQLSQAFEQIKKQDVDLIITTGDLFDKDKPNNEVYFEAIELLNKVDIPNKLGIKSKDGKLLKIPMITITGNHEYRGKDYKSAVQLLEAIGYLKNLHFEHINLGKVSIFGMPSVPDNFAIQIFKKWNPQPVPGNYNILLTHQSYMEFFPFDTDEMLSLSNLPSNFDLIVNGHLHWNVVKELDQGGLFIMPGSTVSTQNKKLEADKPKGYFLLDTETKDLKFFEIENTRPVVYIDLKFKKGNVPEIKKEIEEKITEVTSQEYNKKALVRIRLKGDLDKGYFAKDINISDFEKRFNNLYLSFSNKLEEISLKESIDKLKELNQDKSNLKEISEKIFFEQLAQTNFSNKLDAKRLFELLYNKDVDKAKKYILED